MTQSLVSDDKDQLRPILLAPTSAVEINLLSVPIAVLNAKASKASKRLSYEWVNKDGVSLYAMKRDDDVGFPLIQHAEIFYAMLAMFAQRPNDEGVLYFRLTDIAKNIGATTNGGSVATTIKESIWRYSKCSVEWHQGWYQIGKKPENWDGPLIIKNNVFSTKEVKSRAIRSNPRRSPQKESWHHVTFHPQVIESIKNKFVRIFLTDILKSDLSDSAKCVLRYFYRFSDFTEVSREHQQLMAAFAWTGTKKRFVVWLSKQLEELKNHGAVEKFKMTEDGVVVKCSSAGQYRAIKTAKKIEKPKKSVTEKWPSHIVLAKYFEMKAAGSFSQDEVDNADTLLSIAQESTYIPSLRNLIERSLKAQSGTNH